MTNTGAGRGFPRRRFLQGAAVAAATPALVEPALPTSGAPAAQAVAASGSPSAANLFLNPPRDSAPRFRWWWPAAAVDHDVLAEQLDAVADAGFRGVEIAAVYGLNAGRGVDYPVDPVEYGYGTGRWNAAIDFAVAYGRERNLVVDICMGPQWNVSVPGLDVDGPASVKELVFAAQAITGGSTFAGSVPAPPPRTYIDRTSENGVVSSQTRTAALSLVAAQALRQTGGTPGAPIVDISSAIDLTEHVDGGQLAWSPPDVLDWVVIGAWQRGTAVKPDLPFSQLVPMYSDPEPRCIDYFSRAGVNAFIEHFESQLSSRTATLLKNSGGVLFDDSIEIARGGIRVWTALLLDEFMERRGYDLRPYLAGLGFAASDTILAQRIKRDVDQTFSDLYIDAHLKPFQAWAHSKGLKYQGQPYQTTPGTPIDLALASSLLDVPEGENFDFTARGSEDWRVIACGADMGGHGIVSDEYRPGAGLGVFPYESTPQDLVEQANGQFALGVTHMRMIGIPYPHFPTSIDGNIRDDHTRWPGFHPIGTIPEAMGPRNPTWTMASDVNAYFSRVQFILQQGVRRTDLAVYTQVLGLLLNPEDRFDSASVLEPGYTYGYVSPGTLGLDTATVEGRTLAPNGPAFKALIIANEPSMPLETLQKVLGFADSGLPIIVIGSPPTEASGYASSPERAAQRDLEFRANVESILSKPSVHRIETTAEVAAALHGLGIQPAAISDQPAVRTVRREDGPSGYYFVHNTSDIPVTAELSVEAAAGAKAYSLDPWTGNSRRLIGERGPSGRVTTRIDLPKRGAAIVVMSRDWDASPTPPHRASTASKAPAPLALTSWDLVVDDWQPATPGQPSSAMNHIEWAFTDVPLVPWSDIPQIADASGVGVYTTTVTLPDGWSDSWVTHLDLGVVNGSFRVRIDGESVGVVDQLSTRVDLGARLTPGRESTIEVEIATTLINRVRTVQPTYARRPRKPYGLQGPVHLHFYAGGMPVRNR